MENLENPDLFPESNTPQPETAPVDITEPSPREEAAAEIFDAEQSAPEEASAIEIPEAEPQPPKYEWDCGMAFPPPKAEKIHTPKPRRGIFKRFLAGIAVVALVVSCCLVTGTVLNGYWMEENQALQDQLTSLKSKMDRLQLQVQNSSSVGNGSSVPNTGISGGLTPAQVYAQNVGAVVAISSSTGSGSGFIITDDGYIVTNYHVIENASRVEVTLSNSEKYIGKVVGFDAAHDVTVLKIEAADLPYVLLGSSDALAVGDQITVIGNPLGELSYTQTVGYISGKDRGISTDNIMINMLQTDASINSGNSGGPMFNMKGEVVGIITAKYSGTSSSGASIEGVGFAIPIDDVLKKIQDLIEFGYITGPYLGVSVRDMDSSVSQSFGLPMGAYVVTVEKGNCAYAAGVREKDIITGLGEYTIGSLNDLSSALQEFKAGDTTTIQVWRSGTTLEFTITLDEKPH